MNGEFWATLGLASAVATALATGVSTVAAMWWRRQDRREADWVFFDAGSKWRAVDKYNSEGTPPQGWATLANAGDGSAFRLEATGQGCKAELRGELKTSQVHGSYRPAVALVPVMHPGGTVHLQVWAEPEDWRAAEVVLSWVRSPTWKKRGSRRTLRVPLEQVATRPDYVGERFDEDSGVTRVEPLPEPDGPVLPPSLRPASPVSQPRGRWRWR